jgi:CRP-like cAMP-binding protein
LKYPPKHCEYCTLHKMTLYGAIPDKRLEVIESLRRERRSVRAKRTIYREGRPTDEIAVVFDGWAAAFKLLPDGRRQVLSFLLPGDCTGLALVDSDRLHYSVQALTDVSLCLLDRRELARLVFHDGELAAHFASVCARQRQLCDEHLVDLGRRNAVERVAHLIVTLYHRLQHRGLTENATMPFPLRQQDIADAVGLTPIHVSRVFGTLTGDGIVERKKRMLEVHDMAALKEVASTSDRDLLGTAV